MTTIRVERPQDAPGIRAVNERAFGQSVEADIVDELRRICPDLLSLVAEDGAIVGHILFSPVTVEATGRRVVWSGLAPMAIIHGRQREGIGSALVERGSIRASASTVLPCTSSRVSGKASRTRLSWC